MSIRFMHNNHLLGHINTFTVHIWLKMTKKWTKTIFYRFQHFLQFLGLVKLFTAVEIPETGPSMRLSNHVFQSQ